MSVIPKARRSFLRLQCALSAFLAVSAWAQTPQINPGGAVSGASFAPGQAVAPGSIVSVFGTDLASSAAGAPAVPLPTSLGGATLLFNGGQAVPKFYASPLQVNIQIPWELSGLGSATLTDTVGGTTSSPVTVSLSQYSPGLFAFSQGGVGQGAIIIAGTGGALAAPSGFATSSRPVRSGEFLAIFSTGLGPVTNQPPSGSPASADPLSATLATPQVTLGGIPAVVTYSGLAPGFVGLYQVNVEVPTGILTSNAVPVVISIGGVSSNFVTIAVDGSSVPPVTPPPSVFPNRSEFVRTDSNPIGLGASLPGKFIAYDGPHRQVFYCNRFLNQVEVFSAATKARLAVIPVPDPTGIDLDPSGSAVYVGTGVDFFYVLDPVTYQVLEKVRIGLLQGTYSSARQLVSTSNGTVVVFATSGPYAGEGAIYQWNPDTGSLISRNSPLRLGIARPSRDHTKVLLGSFDSSGQLVLYDALTDTLAATATFYGGIPNGMAANGDGSQFAVLSGPGDMAVYNGQLQEVLRKSVGFNNGAVYSHDNRFLYVFRRVDIFPSVDVYSTVDFSLVGRVPDLRLNANTDTAPQDVDEVGTLFAVGDRGVIFLDVSSPGPLSTSGPWLGFLDPSAGRQNQSTPVSVPVGNPPSTPSAYFGGTKATSVSLVNSILHTSAPPAVAPGPVHFRTFFSGGWFALAPEGFSYGPVVVHNLVAGGPSEGGALGFLTGYGFGSDTSAITVRVGGGLAADVQYRPGSGLDPFPFPMERIRFRVPAGVAGSADITVTTPVGTTTLANGFHYVQHTQVPLGGQLFQGIIDEQRKRIYFTDADRIQVISTETLQPLPPILMPLKPNSMRLTGIALTPDRSKIVVADYGDKLIFVVDADNPSAVSTYDTALPSDGGGIVERRPLYVAATSTGKGFMNMVFSGTGCGLDLVRGLDLATGVVVGRNDLGYSCLASKVAGTPDGNRVYWNSDGAGLAWNAGTDSFILKSVNIYGEDDLAVAADGTRTAFGGYIADGDLAIETPAAYVDVDVINFGLRSGQLLHASGSYLYFPIDFGVEIVDANKGRLLERILILDPVANIANSMLINETGSRIYLVTTAGLSILDFGQPPLGIGSVRPDQGPTTGATQLTIRGSGFQPNTTVRIDDTDATTVFVNENTLQVFTPPHPSGSVRMTVTNPGAGSYSLDAAFVYR